MEVPQAPRLISSTSYYLQRRRATKLIPYLIGLSYSDRRKILNLPTLEFRRRRRRMTEVFKIFKALFDPAVTEDTFCVHERDTRENPYKVKGKDSKSALQKHFFTTAEFNDWNSFPEGVVTSESINVF